ncbi:hypothetical protein CR513_32036, partial [Mucuna pruriens]
MGPNRGNWCKFNRAYNHMTEECQTLQFHIERLIQEGHLDQYVMRKKDRDQVGIGRERREEQRRIGHEDTRQEGGSRERSRSKRRADTWHIGTIATISSGGVRGTLTEKA